MQTMSTTSKKSLQIRRLTYSAVFLALAMVLPFLTGQIQTIGQLISPLHIPALICGLVCGWPCGLAVGVLSPLLRALLFGMPPFPNAALPMAFECGAYGLLTGLLYPIFLRVYRKESHLPAILTALILAMLGGRIVGGAAKAALFAFGIIGSQSPYTFAVFFASYFTSTAPGAAIHIVLIPAIVLALERAKLSLVVKGDKA